MLLSTPNHKQKKRRIRRTPSVTMLLLKTLVLPLLLRVLNSKNGGTIVVVANTTTNEALDPVYHHRHHHDLRSPPRNVNVHQKHLVRRLRVTPPRTPQVSISQNIHPSLKEILIENLFTFAHDSLSHYIF
jgi:hypothetical protein